MSRMQAWADLKVERSRDLKRARHGLPLRATDHERAAGTVLSPGRVRDPPAQAASPWGQVQAVKPAACGLRPQWPA